MVTRREFLATAAFSYVASGFSRTFSGRTLDAAAAMHVGYAAITWGANITQAMDDIAAVGFRAIQLRGEAFAQFGDKPAALREMLERVTSG